MSLTLTDAVPANRAYTATQSDPDLTVWKDVATNTYPSGAGVATLSLKENAQTGVARLTGKLTVPQMDTVDPTTVAFSCLGTFEIVLPNRASLQHRKNLKAMLIDFLGDGVVTSAVESFVHPTAV
jgi:hypothetical protein